MSKKFFGNFLILSVPLAFIYNISFSMQLKTIKKQKTYKNLTALINEQGNFTLKDNTHTFKLHKAHIFDPEKTTFKFIPNTTEIAISNGTFLNKIIYDKGTLIKDIWPVDGRHGLLESNTFDIDEEGSYLVSARGTLLTIISLPAWKIIFEQHKTKKIKEISWENGTSFQIHYEKHSSESIDAEKIKG